MKRHIGDRLMHYIMFSCNLYWNVELIGAVVFVLLLFLCKMEIHS